MCDLLWSDPDGAFRAALFVVFSNHSSVDINGWGLSPRGAGFLFCADITKQFAHQNAIDLIARAHQLAMEGYKLMFDQMIVTVWSAPNYCYRSVLFFLPRFLGSSRNRCGNVASILELDEHLSQEYKVFSHAPSVCTAFLCVNGLDSHICLYQDIRSIPAKRPPADYFL